MNLQHEVAVELRRRADLLPQEIARWQSLTNANQAGMGIHRSQIAAVQTLFAAMQERQSAALATFQPDAPFADFVAQRDRIEGQLTQMHALLSVFRYILNQRTEGGGSAGIAGIEGNDPGNLFRQTLDAADLIAADIYRTSLMKAREWHVLTEDQFREPPLTYLNSSPSPAAFTRRHTFGAFEFRFVGADSAARLPISCLSLPIHHAAALWNLSALYHEVGHLLDQDLGLRAALAPVVQATISLARWSVWEAWLREVIADVWGVLHGGPAFVQTLLRFLLLPADQVAHFDDADVHPTPYVRVFLLTALLRECGYADAATATETLWTGLYPTPVNLAPLIADCTPIAHAVLATPLDALRGHALGEFVPESDRAINDAKVAALGLHLRVGTPLRDRETFPVRLVPAGARAALSGMDADEADPAAKQAKIQERTLKLVAAIPRPEFLAAPLAPARRVHLRQLSDDALAALSLPTSSSDPFDSVERKAL